VDHIAGSRAPLSQVTFRQKTQGFTIHLKSVHINFFKIKFFFTILEKLSNLVPSPCSGIVWKTSWQTGLDVALQWAGGRLGQEGVGIPPEKVRGEGERKGESVHAVGKLDGGNLHVVLGSRGLAAIYYCELIVLSIS